MNTREAKRILKSFNVCQLTRSALRKKTAVPGEVNVDKVNLQDPHTADPDVSLAAVFVKY